jgi:hypothetical protein
LKKKKKPIFNANKINIIKNIEEKNSKGISKLKRNRYANKIVNIEIIISKITKKIVRLNGLRANK